MVGWAEGWGVVGAADTVGEALGASEAFFVGAIDIVGLAVGNKVGPFVGAAVITGRVGTGIGGTTGGAMGGATGAVSVTTWLSSSCDVLGDSGSGTAGVTDTVGAVVLSCA